MKAVCIFNSTDILSGGHGRKEDLYPTLIRIFETAGFDSVILGGNIPPKRQTAIKEVTNGTPTIHSQKVNLPVLTKFLIASRPIGVAPQLIRKYSYELTAVGNYIAHNSPPDIILALQSTEYSGIIAYLIKQVYDIPYAILEHKSHFGRETISGRRLHRLREVIQSAKVMLPVSDSLRHDIERTVSVEIDSGNIVPNPVPEYFFERPTRIELLPAIHDSDKFIFGAWCDWRDLKRIDLALDAFQEVVSEHSSAHLILAGPVPTEATAVCERLGIGDSVTFPGQLDRDGIHQLAYLCDCHILTSDYETFGLPIIEAMATGSPSIATKCGGPESIIVDDAYGRLVERDDPDAFAKAMKAVLENYQTFSAEGIKTYCRDSYGETALSAHIKKLFENRFPELCEK